LKILSIRKKLTLWYSLIIIIISIILFISFYVLTEKYLIYETDRSLALHSSQVVYSLENSDNNIHSSQTETLMEISGDETPGMFIKILDEEGRNIDSSVSEYQKLADHAVNTNQPVFSNMTVNDTTMRLIANPIYRDNKIEGVVLMGHQIDVYEKTLLQLKSIGLVVLLLLITPAIYIGNLLAKSAIDPIRKISRDINTITTENLARPLEAKIDSEETFLLVNNFNSLLERLHKGFILEKQFLGEMAHEVKTPLAVIKSNAEVTLSKDRTTEEYKHSIQQTLKHIDKLTNNLFSLMDFAWAQNPKVKDTFTKFNLSQLMEEICNVAEFNAAPKNIIVDCNLLENVYVVGKEEKLYQAFYNILDNAIKFTPENGKVTIELNQDKDWNLIIVTDSGIGISKQDQTNIFNRFYRTEATRNTSGYGLG
jgi:signal transduction histidine kinase